MTDDHRAQDRRLARGASEPTGAESPDSPLERLLALAEERPLTVEDFLAAREDGDLTP